ncbi:MAG: DUF488 family protein [Thermoanaerobaculia bacterium]
MTLPVFTVGHSNRSIAVFLEILRAHGVRRIVDVRRHPHSRKWPHFDAGALAERLRGAGIDYVGMPELGGRRKPRPDSPHTAWRVDAFRGYADFMDTPEFHGALDPVVALSQTESTALMCAEALPWRCHRSLIADALLARALPVREILSVKEARPRQLPAFARLDGERVVYDVGELPLGRSSRSIKSSAT